MFQTKTGPKLSIPTVKTGRKSLSLSGVRGGDEGYLQLLQSLLRQITQALIIFLAIRLSQSSQSFYLNSFNV